MAATNFSRSPRCDSAETTLVHIGPPGNAENQANRKMATPTPRPDASIDSSVEDAKIGSEGTKLGPHEEASAKLKKIPASTSGTRHLRRNAAWSAPPPPARVGRLRLEKYRAANR